MDLDYLGLGEAAAYEEGFQGSDLEETGKEDKVISACLRFPLFLYEIHCETVHFFTNTLLVFPIVKVLLLKIIEEHFFDVELPLFLKL